MKNLSLSPHSIIQPSAPQNMQELASHLVCAACIVHLTPHSLHHAPRAILYPRSDHGLHHLYPPYPRSQPMPPQTASFAPFISPLAPSTACTCVRTPVHPGVWLSSGSKLEHAPHPNVRVSGPA